MRSVQSVERPTTHGAQSPPNGDANPSEIQSRTVLGMRIDATSYRETAEAIASLAEAGIGGSVCVATVHMVMEAFDDPAFRAIVNAADRVTPDGVPLVWALRRLGIADAQRVYGPTLLPVVCALAAERGLAVGFYGGSPEVLEEMTRRLLQRTPGLEIAFVSSPPFRPLTSTEEEKVTAEIRASGTRILFVGLGCPKQERWIDRQRASLSCVMVGVGAAFDFQAGAKPQAAGWIQRSGLEWLFRLATEPRRLWHRYLYHNPRFLFFVGREWVADRQRRRRRSDRRRQP